jgi:hypothetical protein
MDSFNAAEEVLNDPALKSVFKTRSIMAVRSLPRKRTKNERQFSRSEVGPAR